MARAGTYAARRQLRDGVVEAVGSGASLTAAAATLGIRVDYAARLLRDGIAALPGMEVEDLRGITEIRLDALAAVYATLMRSDDERTALAGANGLLAVERDRTKLLGTYLRPEKD